MRASQQVEMASGQHEACRNSALHATGAWQACCSEHQDAGSMTTLRRQQIMIQLQGDRPGRPLPPLWLHREHEGHQLTSGPQVPRPRLSPLLPHCRIQSTEEPAQHAQHVLCTRCCCCVQLQCGAFTCKLRSELRAGWF